jgi:hypothetical protein
VRRGCRSGGRGLIPLAITSISKDLHAISHPIFPQSPALWEPRQGLVVTSRIGRDVGTQ